MALSKSFIKNYKNIKQKTKDTVNGYCHEFKKANNHNVPKLINSWIIMFRGDDEYFKKISKKCQISEQGKTLKKEDGIDEWDNVNYGAEVMSSKCNFGFEWKLKILGDNMAMLIGVSSSKKDNASLLFRKKFDPKFPNDVSYFISASGKKRAFLC